MKTSDLDLFTRAYLVCALWSSNDESTPAGGVPFDQNYSLEDIAPESVAKAFADCAKFQKEQDSDLTASELDSTRAGNRFWLNRNGHGTGFWDEYFEESERAKACDRLSEACKAFGECCPYLGDDGKIYLS